MRANDQRQIIEQLLGITLLSEKATKIKEKIRDTRDLQKSEELRLKAIQEANRRVQEQIESLKMRQSMWATKQTEDTDAMAKAIVSMSSIDIDAEVIAHKELAEYLVADAEVTSLKESLKRLSKESTREASTIAKLESEIAQLTDHKCYACGQSVHDDKQQEVLSSKQNQLETHKTHLRTLEQDSAITHEKVAAIGVLKKPSKTFYTSLEEALNHRNTLEVLKRDLENRRTETNPYSEQIVEMESRAIQEISYDKINEYTRILDHQEFLQKLLTNKDSFIRKKIIEQNLSYLNARLTYYLDKIGLPHSVVFQNDLSVLIEELGRELDFDNLSRGERNRLIVGLSLAFRDVWESLYLPINLFFVDELLDSGMDQIGTENSLAILKKMTRERKKSVWLISHKEELISRAENVLRVVKENGFTTFCASE
jgi:chromosome segregation ATPase